MADDFIPWWVPDDHPLRQPAPLPTVFRDPSTGRFTAEPHDDESTESAPPEDAAAAATDGVARDERGDHNGEGSLQQSANRPPKMPLSKVATDRGNFRIGK